MRRTHDRFPVLYRAGDRQLIGMGIFVLPASLAPHGLNALGWIIVLAGCLALARVFSHLAHALPPAPFAPELIAAGLPLYALKRLWRRADPSAKVLP